MDVEQKIYRDPDVGDVKLVKSGRAGRINIRIHPVRGITVTVPALMRYEAGLDFYLSKRKWVLEAVEKQRKKTAAAERAGTAVSVIGDGTVVRTLLSEICFLREKSSGNLQRAKVSVVPLEDLAATGRLFLCLDRPVTRKTVTYSSAMPPEGTADLSSMLSMALVRILRDESRVLLPKKLAFFADRYGFRYNNLAVKHNLSNWGSCSSKGNINLNLNLLRLPEPLCDYVVLHELCHLKHPDHGPGFHALLERLCADNMDRLVSLAGTVTGDSSDVRYLRELLKSAGTSKAVHPVHHILEKEIKKYRLL